MPDFEPNLDPEPLPKIPLPQGWTDLAILALLHVIALARIAILNARHLPDGSECDGLRLRAENDRLRSEIALLERELSIKDARFNRLAPKKRPEFLPAERLEILLIKTARGPNNTQLATSDFRSLCKPFGVGFVAFVWVTTSFNCHQSRRGILITFALSYSS